MIVVECPQCNTALRIPEKYAGQFGSCKKCGARLRVPRAVFSEGEHGHSQPPAPILPSDEPTSIRIATRPPVVSPVVYSPAIPYDDELKEPVRYRPVRRRPQQRDDIDKRFILGLAGSISLCIGVFAPLVTVPILGALNFFSGSQAEGAIVLGFGVVSLLMVLMKQYDALWITGIGSLAMIIRSFVQVRHDIEQKRFDLEAGNISDPFEGLANSMTAMTQVQWGWAVLLIGSILLIAGAAMVDDNESRGLRYRRRDWI